MGNFCYDGRKHVVTSLWEGDKSKVIDPIDELAIAIIEQAVDDYVYARSLIILYEEEGKHQKYVQELNAAEKICNEAIDTSPRLKFMRDRIKELDDIIESLIADRTEAASEMRDVDAIKVALSEAIAKDTMESDLLRAELMITTDKDAIVVIHARRKYLNERITLNQEDLADIRNERSKVYKKQVDISAKLCAARKERKELVSKYPKELAKYEPYLKVLPILHRAKLREGRVRGEIQSARNRIREVKHFFGSDWQVMLYDGRAIRFEEIQENMERRVREHIKKIREKMEATERNREKRKKAKKHD